MLRFHMLTNKPHVVRQLTGISLQAFVNLLPTFAEVEAVLQEQQRTTPRQRKPGGGRKPRLPTVADRLLFILFYFKIYPIQEVQAFFFGMSQTQACEWVHRLTPVLNQTLGVEQQLPERNPDRMVHVLRKCPGLEFIIDGTERPMQRPQERVRRKLFYSGKKKRHTLKNIVVVDRRSRKIKVLGRTHPGRTHDKKAADTDDLRFPKGSRLLQDSGFQGYEPPGVQTAQPTKKPKNGTLTPEAKAANTALARERVIVEHAIGGAKVFHIVHDVYRNHRPGFEDLIMETACGLHNLRCDYPFAIAA